jgi:hypothetical protein
MIGIIPPRAVGVPIGPHDLLDMPLGQSQWPFESPPPGVQPGAVPTGINIPLVIAI